MGRSKTYSNHELTVTVKEGEFRLEVSWFGHDNRTDTEAFVLTVLQEVISLANKLQKPIHMDFSALEHMRFETSKLIIRILQETPGSNSTFSIKYDSSKPWQELHFSTL